ncbi:MAG: 50S ribosomal protein L18e [Candidatus Micrarchaeaceae archaeon]
MRSNVERSDIRSIISFLEGNIAENKKRELSRKLLKLIDVPTRKRRSASIYKINKFTKDNESVIVPGKVLSEGAMDHKVSIAALSYSKKAKEELKRSGARLARIEELINEKGVRIIV